jgi:hypothetical protein
LKETLQDNEVIEKIKNEIKMMQIENSEEVVKKIEICD